MKDINNNIYQLKQISFADKNDGNNAQVDPELETSYITSNNVNELKNVINENAAMLDQYGNNVTNALIIISGLIGSDNFDELLEKISFNQYLLRQL